MRRTFISFLAIALLVFSSLTGGTLSQNLSVNKTRTSSPASSALKLSLPLKQGSVRFAVMGDTGSGTEMQQQVADMMIRYRELFPFDFVLMMGDNLYGGETPADYQKKFSDVYQKLLDNKVKFYATLGNHDQPNERFYQNFNMNGKEYYRFSKGNVAFYSLNSTYMDKTQLKWLEDELMKDTSRWKICFFHHPPYSSAKKHGSDNQVREVVEPIFLRYGVNMVLTGHDHVYEHVKPQKKAFCQISERKDRRRRRWSQNSEARMRPSFRLLK